MRKHTVEQLERRQLLAVITNGLPQGDPAYLAIDVGNAGAFGSVAPGTSGGGLTFGAQRNVMFQYDAFLDLGAGRIGTGTTASAAVLLSTYATQVTLLSENMAQSSGRITLSDSDANASNNPYIDFTVTVSLPLGGNRVNRTLSFSSSNFDLRTAKLFEYMDADIFAISDDVMVVRGNVPNQTLSLSTVDGQTYTWLSQEDGTGNSGAALSGFAADQYADLLTAIGAGGYDALPAGTIDTTDLPLGPQPRIGTGYGPEDITTALEYTFQIANAATVSTSLQLRASLAEPAMEVYYYAANTLVPDGSVTRDATIGTDFGNFPSVQIFEIRDFGTEDLQLLGDPAVVISGPNAESFRIIRQPMTYIGAGNSTYMFIEYVPAMGGTQVADVTIHSNDLRTTPYTFRIYGGSGQNSTSDAYEDDGPIADPVLVNENFNSMVAGLKPSYWSASNGDLATTTVRKFVSSDDRQLRLKDGTSRGSATILKTFRSTSSVLDAEFRFNTAINGSSFQLRSGNTAAVDLYVVDNELVYRDADGAQIPVGEVLNDTWYTIRIVADPTTDTFDLFVNDEQSVDDGAFRTPVNSVNQIRFATDRVAKGILYIDDVKVTAFQAVRDHARAISTQGVGQIHSLHAGTDADWLRFELENTSNVVIETFAPAGDTRVSLYDASGNRLAYDNDSGPGRSAKIGNENEYGRGALTLEPGTYYIRVDENGNNAVVPLYMLYVRAGEVAATAPAAIDAQGKLHIAGTSQDDIISVEVFGTSLRVLRNNNTWYFPIGDVSGIEIDAASGDDTIHVGAGVRPTTILGGSGSDVITNESAMSALVEGGDGDDVIVSGDGRDTIDGGTGNDSIDGRAGNDRLLGGAGDDLIYGGDGNDDIMADLGNDTVYGEAGNDSITGHGGNDSLFGDEGNDVITGDEGRDYVDAGEGNDQITTWHDGQADTVVANPSSDMLFVDDNPAGVLDVIQEVAV